MKDLTSKFKRDYKKLKKQFLMLRLNKYLENFQTNLMSMFQKGFQDIVFKTKKLQQNGIY